MAFHTPGPHEAPALPFEVALFLTGEMARYEAALDGGIPESEEVISHLNTELAKVDDETDPADLPGGEEYYYARQACATWMIMNELNGHLAILESDISSLSDEEVRRIARQGMVYARMLRSGLELLQWWEQRNNEEELEWPTSLHLICVAATYQAVEDLGDEREVAILVENVELHSLSLLLDDPEDPLKSPEL